MLRLAHIEISELEWRFRGKGNKLEKVASRCKLVHSRKHELDIIAAFDSNNKTFTIRENSIESAKNQMQMRIPIFSNLVSR